jgi:hypothetical protein
LKLKSLGLEERTTLIVICIIEAIFSSFTKQEKKTIILQAISKFEDLGIFTHHSINY